MHVAEIVAALEATPEEIARTLGVEREALAIEDHVDSAKAQDRLSALIRLVARLENRFPSPRAAYDWCRTSPLPGYGGLTAMQLVREGRASEALDAIDAIDAGLHA